MTFVDELIEEHGTEKALKIACGIVLDIATKTTEMDTVAIEPETGLMIAVGDAAFIKALPEIMDDLSQRNEETQPLH